MLIFLVYKYNYFPNSSSSNPKNMMIFLLKNNYFLIFFFLAFSLLMSSDLFMSESYLYIFEFYFSNSISFSLPILLDFYSILFSLTVLFISSNIMKFSTFYMADEMFKTRFLSILLLFILSMLFLIFIPNLVFLMIGWDGLGMSSFYLIMYYQNQKSLGASMITLLSNRIGDLCLLLSITIFFSLGSTFLNYGLALSILLMTGCFTKSAQFPFMSWLPAAMAAPTPVSALVHSSTLVTAGVYLMIRFSFVILKNEKVVFFIAAISSLTMLISALAAMFETDFKKIIALSTLSQLGFMMFSLSQMMKMCSFFHLVTHAIFKSLLFICAGAVIIFSGHNQDIRALPKFMNSVIQSCFIIASMALMSVPFMVGFYSKDLILEMFFQNQSSNWLFVVIVFISSWLTVAYTLRMIYLSSWQTPNFKFFPFVDSKSLTPMYKAVSFSALASIFAGSMLSWLFSFETKFFIPSLLSEEMMFICSFIFFGSITFVIFLNLKPIKSLLYLFYLTPVLQKSPESVMKFSKKLYNYSDLAWLEKVSYSELSFNSMHFSHVVYSIISNKVLMKQLTVMILFLFIFSCL